MAFSQETIEQIRLATDIVELVREYVPSLKKAGRNWKAQCPFHNEKTPSFTVNPEKGIFHCFGCHAGGDVFKFVTLIDHLNWPEAVQKLAGRAGITVKETREEIIKRSEKQKIFDLLELVANFYHRCLKESKSAAAPGYLNQRGVTNETIDRFLIGFAPRTALVPAALKKGYTHEQLIAAGVITKTERGSFFEYMSERVVFPIFDTQGRIVAFGGRTLKDEQPKYLNTPETAVYSKSAQLYGLNESIPTIRNTKEAIILEGYMDVVITHQCGVPYTVATLGTALTAIHARMLGRYCENVTLLFDADAAGRDATRRAIDTFIETEIALRIVTLPDGLDPDEFILKVNKDGFLSHCNTKGVPAVEFLTALALEKWGKSTPEAKVKAASEVMPTLARIKNNILRREWIKYLAEKLNTTEDALQAEYKRAQSPLKGRRVKNDENVSAAPSTGLRSPEEEILQILFARPELGSHVNDDVFDNERNKETYRLFASGIPASQIVAHLNDEDARWFTELLVEERNYANPEQVLSNVLRDVQLARLRRRRQKLEEEVTAMINGNIPKDEDKIRAYNELTKQLKGSVK